MHKVNINNSEHSIIFGHKSLEIFCDENTGVDDEGKRKSFSAIDALQSLTEPKYLYRYYYAALQAGAYYDGGEVIGYKEFMLAIDTDDTVFPAITKLFNEANGIKK
jgi:hypothetical protein